MSSQHVAEQRLDKGDGHLCDDRLGGDEQQRGDAGLRTAARAQGEPAPGRRADDGEGKYHDERERQNPTNPFRALLAAEDGEGEYGRDDDRVAPEGSGGSQPPPSGLLPAAWDE